MKLGTVTFSIRSGPPRPKKGSWAHESEHYIVANLNRAAEAEKVDELIESGWVPVGFSKGYAAFWLPPD